MCFLHLQWWQWIDLWCMLYDCRQNRVMCVIVQSVCKSACCMTRQNIAICQCTVSIWTLHQAAISVAAQTWEGWTGQSQEWEGLKKCLWSLQTGPMSVVYWRKQGTVVSFYVCTRTDSENRNNLMNLSQPYFCPFFLYLEYTF